MTIIMSLREPRLIGIHHSFEVTYFINVSRIRGDTFDRRVRTIYRRAPIADIRAI